MPNQQRDALHVLLIFIIMDIYFYHSRLFLFLWKSLYRTRYNIIDYQDYTHHSITAPQLGQHPDPEDTKLKHRQGKKISEIIRHTFFKNILSTYICILCGNAVV